MSMKNSNDTIGNRTRTDDKYKITNWKKRSRNRADWENSIKEAKVVPSKKKKKKKMMMMIMMMMMMMKLFLGV
jgi:hypothetical protein